MKQSQLSASKPVKIAKGLSEAPTTTDSHQRIQEIHRRIIKSYFRDNVLDLSEASDFYKREAAVTEELGDCVQRLHGERFKLKGVFGVSFRRCFPLFLSDVPADPPDALAHSLFRMAQQWANSSYANSLPGDWRCTRPEALSGEWRQSWERVLEEDWVAFRRMSSPTAQYITTALDEKGKVKHELCYTPTARHVNLGVSFQRDTKLNPEMRILIQGDPAVSFFIAYVRKSQGQRRLRGQRRELRNLRVIFESVVSTIEKEFLGLTGQMGRPRDIGERAAYLLYHQRKAIRLVSRELCALREEPNHICDFKCHDKTKKAAANHFKHLRRELQAAAKSSMKKLS
jgi:hypothetical protein